MSVSRRDFLRMSSVMAAAVATGCGGSSNSFSPVLTDFGPPAAAMVQPPELRSTGGRLVTTFNISYADVTVTTPAGDRTARLRTWNGFLGGPTFRVKPGDQVTVLIQNNLPPNTDPIPPDHNTPHHFNTINLHTHGLHVSPEQDNVLINIEPGTSYTYIYDIPDDHPPGTFWYHAHTHGKTAMHLLSGMLGLFIVEGGADNVPEVRSATDLDFVISEINLSGLSSEPPIVEPYEVPDYVIPSPFVRADSFFLVNGQRQPEITVTPGRTIRLRVLNGSVRNTMPIAIDNSTLNVMSLDGITLNQVKPLSEVRLAPANRADILLQFDNPGTYRILKKSFQNGGGAPTPEEVLATVVVDGPQQTMTLPTTLPTPAQLPTILASEITERRELVYAVSNMNGPMVGNTQAANFTINGKRFNPNRVDQTIPLDAVIEWTISNTSGAWHSHHIHVNPFQVVATSTGELNGFPLTEPVWLDTVDIPPMGSVTVRQRFPDFTGMFVLHCHVLVHEDIGMMQLVNVV